MRPTITPSPPPSPPSPSSPSPPPPPPPPPEIDHLTIINEYFSAKQLWDEGDFFEWCIKSGHPNDQSRLKNFWLNSLKNSEFLRTLVRYRAISQRSYCCVPRQVRFGMKTPCLAILSLAHFTHGWFLIMVPCYGVMQCVQFACGRFSPFFFFLMCTCITALYLNVCFLLKFSFCFFFVFFYCLHSL